MYFPRKNLGQKIKKKEIFFNNLCKFFPKKNLNLLIKKFILLYLLSNNKNIKKLNKKFRKKIKTYRYFIISISKKN